MLIEPCPCGSDQEYRRCCAPFHQNQASAPNPEALMRSRYSAFCREDSDYLLKTHHPKSRHSNEQNELEGSFANTVWLGLKVIKHTKQADRGVVEFAAWFRERAEADKDSTLPQQMHERSNFLQENGQWYYLDGEQLAHYELPRNETCWCGSGKKYKRCHKA